MLWTDADRGLALQSISSLTKPPYTQLVQSIELHFGEYFRVAGSARLNAVQDAHRVDGYLSSAVGVSTIGCSSSIGGLSSTPAVAVRHMSIVNSVRRGLH